MSLVLREEHVEPTAVWAITKKTGLRYNTVHNLLRNGWTYEEALDQPPRWIHPIARMKEVRPNT